MDPAGEEFSVEDFTEVTDAIHGLRNYYINTSSTVSLKCWMEKLVPQWAEEFINPSASLSASIGGPVRGRRWCPAFTFFKTLKTFFHRVLWKPPKMEWLPWLPTSLAFSAAQHHRVSLPTSSQTSSWPTLLTPNQTSCCWPPVLPSCCRPPVLPSCCQSPALYSCRWSSQVSTDKLIHWHVQHSRPPPKAVLFMSMASCPTSRAVLPICPAFWSSWRPHPSALFPDEVPRTVSGQLQGHPPQVSCTTPLQFPDLTAWGPWVCSSVPRPLSPRPVPACLSVCLHTCIWTHMPVSLYTTPYLK